jgi:hypothetical protein
METRARVIGSVLAALGIILMVTPRYIFPVCGYGEPGLHACHGTLKAETVLAAITIVIGLLPVLWPLRRTALAASVSALVIAALVVLFPVAITGMCKMPTMACLMGTLPALVTVGVIIALTGGAGIAVVFSSRDSS